MTKTENYQLNQWEPTDKISRADFNADNAAIDAAIKAVADAAQAANTTAASAVEIAKTAAFTIGSYTGNGLELSDGGFRVELGFRPRFLLITKGWYLCNGMSASTLIYTQHPNVGVWHYVVLDDTGFTVGLCSSNGSYALKVNSEDTTYDFVALR